MKVIKHNERGSRATIDGTWMLFNVCKVYFALCPVFPTYLSISGTVKSSLVTVRDSGLTDRYRTQVIAGFDFGSKSVFLVLRGMQFSVPEILHIQCTPKLLDH